jgi:hypothetical protein
MNSSIHKPLSHSSSARFVLSKQQKKYACSEVHPLLPTDALRSPGMHQPPLPSDLPLASLKQVILTTGPFLFVWSYLRGYVSKHGAFPVFSTIITINSILYAAFSALLSYLLIQSYLLQHASPDKPISIPLPLGLTIPFLDKSTLTIAEMGYIYHLSKFYEYIDVINLVGQGKVVGPHMAFHHITTPYLTCFRVLGCTGEDWRVFALANTVHHTLLYAYFGGIGDWLKRIIPVTGCVQLALGVGVDVWWMYLTEGGRKVEGTGALEDEARNRGIAILVLVRYGMLFAEELKGGRAGMGKEEREKLQAQGGEEVEGKKRK